MSTTRSFISRRNFMLNGTAQAFGMGLGLSSCAQLDRVIVGDGANERNSVLILGAGLSGLVAARELRKQGVPFRIFEASHRIGGRILSLENFNSADACAELGAEWISAKDEFAINLCKELKIKLIASDTLQFPHVLYDSNWIEAKSFKKRLLESEKKITQMRSKLSDYQWDQISCEDFISDLRSVVDEEMTSWLRSVMQLKWGAELKDVSALTYFDHFQKSPFGSQFLSDYKYKINGGSRNIVQSLYDKISGVVPNRYVVFSHQLEAIKNKGDFLQLEFATPETNYIIDAKVVICTIPFSVLRGIQGIENIDFTPIKLKAIYELGYGSKGKIVAGFSNTFWQNLGTSWTGKVNSGWIWEQSKQNMLSDGSGQGVLTAEISGKAGQSLGAHSIQSLQSDIKKIHNAKNSISDTVQLMNWHLHQFSLGSSAFFKPTQVHQFSSILTENERKGSFIFAGEHTSLNSMGNMNGAIESGVRAAQEAAKFKNELLKGFAS